MRKYDPTKYPNLARLDRMVVEFLKSPEAKEMSEDEQIDGICRIHPVYWMERYGCIKTGKVGGKKHVGVKIVRIKLNRPELRMADWACEAFVHQPWRRFKGLILKHRKVGCSTLFALFDYYLMRYMPNAGLFLIADKAKHTTNIFSMVELAYRRDKAPFKPRRVPMDKDKKGLKLSNGAMLECDSGETKNPGTSQTLLSLHMSENSKWKFPEDAETSLLNSVEREGFAFQIKESTAFESTARGAKFADDAAAAAEGKSDWRFLFVPWYDTEDCVLALKPGEELEYTTEETELISTYDLSPEQIAFRRDKIHDIGVGRFRQDFPINEREAFLVSQTNYFNVELVKNRIEDLDFWMECTATDFDQAIKQKKFETFHLWWLENKDKPDYGRIRGDFIRELQSRVITPRKVQVMKVNGRVTYKANPELREGEGCVMMWRPPSPRRPYVVSVDSAEGISVDEYTSDLSVIEVFDCYKREQVAEFAGVYDEEVTALYAVLLAQLYNGATLAIEINNKSGGVVLEKVTKEGYHHLYRTQRVSRGQIVSTEPGWRTTKGNKQSTCAQLKLDFKNGHVLLHSRPLLVEMLYLVEDKGKLHASSRNTDDRVMAASIAVKIIEQTPSMRSMLPEEVEQVIERGLVDVSSEGVPFGQEHYNVPLVSDAPGRVGTPHPGSGGRHTVYLKRGGQHG